MKITTSRIAAGILNLIVSKEVILKIQLKLAFALLLICNLAQCQTKQVLTNIGPRSAAWFLKFLSSINNFSQLELLCGCSSVDKVLGWGAEGPWFDSRSGRILKRK